MELDLSNKRYVGVYVGVRNIGFWRRSDDLEQLKQEAAERDSSLCTIGILDTETKKWVWNWASIPETNGDKTSEILGDGVRRNARVDNDDKQFPGRVESLATAIRAILDGWPSL